MRVGGLKIAANVLQSTLVKVRWKTDFIEKNTPVPMSGMFKKSENMAW